MYRIMYKANEESGWECIGSYNDISMAEAEVERLKGTVLASGRFVVIPRGDEKYLD